MNRFAANRQSVRLLVLGLGCLALANCSGQMGGRIDPRYGVAASALKHSIPGDFAWITSEEVEALRKGHGLRISR